MKKFMLTALAVCFVFVFASCGSAPAQPAAQNSTPAPAEPAAQNSTPAPAEPAAQNTAPVQTEPTENKTAAWERALAEEFAAELAAAPKLTADGQADLSGYSDDELYAMLENGVSPNEEAGIDLFAFVPDETAAGAAYADAELELKEPEILPFAEGPVPDDGFVMEELSPEMQAALEELESQSNETDPGEIEELAGEMEELQGQLDEAMQNLQELGIDLSLFGLQGLIG